MFGRGSISGGSYGLVLAAFAVTGSVTNASLGELEKRYVALEAAVAASSTMLES